MVTLSPRGRLTASGQRLWGWGALRRKHQQFANVDGQSACQPIQQVDGRIEPAPLNIADRGAIHASIDGKVLLADAALGPSLPKIPCNARATIHGAQSINLPHSIPSDISDVLYLAVWGDRMLRVFAGIGRGLWGAVLLLTTSAVLAQESVRIAEYVTPTFESYLADQEKLASAPQPAAPDIRAVDAAPAPPPMRVEQRNAIGTVYRDFCDPNFGTSYDLSGPMDGSLYEPYRNQLLTRYQSNCTAFFVREVTQIIALRDLPGLLLPSTGKTQIDTDGAFMLGVWLFLAHHPDITVCVGEGEPRRRGLADMFPASDLVPFGTIDSLSSIAVGYANALGLWVELRQQRRMPACDGLLTLSSTAMAYRQLTSANFKPAL